MSWAPEYELEIVTDEEMPHIREGCQSEGVLLIVVPEQSKETTANSPTQ